ncbi:Nicotinamide riboside kinase 1 [Blattella germanica]|nr:Nicotinamide riboside kinase 1 [Blattella germanica]
MWLIIGVSGATCSGKSTLARSLKDILPGSEFICQDDFFLPEDSERHTFIPALKHNNWEIMSSLDMDKMHKTVDNILSSGNPSSIISFQTLETITTNITGKDKALQKTSSPSPELVNVPGSECKTKANGEISARSKCETKVNGAPHGLNELQSSKSTPGVNILIIEGFIIFNDKKLADLCQMKYFLTLSKEECWARRSVRTYNPPDVPGYFDVCVWPEYVKHRDQVFKEVSGVNVIDGTLDKTSILNQVLIDIVNTARQIISKKD